MSNRHSATDLKQLQSLPLEAKIRMSQERIRIWYESWVRFDIYNKKTKKTRFVTIDRRDAFAEPQLKENEYIMSEFDGQVYVSFSGGKDSTVLADLCARVCKQYGWTLYLLFVNTGLEYPEIQKFVKIYAEWLRNTYKIEVVLDIVRPEMRFDEVVKKYGYPVISKEIAETIFYARNAKPGKYKNTRVQRLNGEWKDKNGNKSAYNCEKWKFMLDAEFDSGSYCCTVMKKRPSAKYAKATGRKQIVGTLASESRLRRQSWVKNGCNSFDAKKPSSQPLSFWTEQDILHYLKEYNVPYCPVYGDIQVKKGREEFEGQVNMIDFLGCYEPEDELETTGCDRTGCIFCMFGCHLEKEPNRFQRLKQTHPRQYEYCINGGEYEYAVFHRHEGGEWEEFDISWEYDDGTPMSKQEIERFAQIHSVGFNGTKEEEMELKVEKRWQPNKEGLGLGKVLDFIGVKYE